MATIEKALQIAAQAHEGQKDKGGEPYILHPLRAMMSVQGEEAQIVAVLHDVIEDTSVTADDLRQAGFSDQIVDAVLCVTQPGRVLCRVRHPLQGQRDCPAGQVGRPGGQFPAGSHHSSTGAVRGRCCPAPQILPLLQILG